MSKSFECTGVSTPAPARADRKSRSSCPPAPHRVRNYYFFFLAARLGLFLAAVLGLFAVAGLVLFVEAGLGLFEMAGSETP